MTEQARTLDPIVGFDGFAMLALSALVLTLSLGVSFLPALAHVLRTAWTTPAALPGAARIIVLGHRLRPDGTPSRHFRHRLDRARALHAQSGAEIFLLGGCTRPAGPSEAKAGAAYLRARSVPPDRLRCEDRSRHTLENLRAYRAAFPAAPGGTAVLVTSRFHLARASLLAGGLGLAHLPCAAEAGRAHLARLPGTLLFEAFLIHWYIVGRGFCRWTGDARMTARIS